MVNAAIRPSRADYYQVLADTLPKDALVVTSLGNASYLWAAMHHRPENFYFEDAMGLALPLALGLAIAQPARPVVVVEGDGAVLMHMGALVTVGAVAPGNLTVLLIQNGVHAASGGQALTNATYRYIETLADMGLTEACRSLPSLIGGINVMNGEITHPAVAEAHGLPCQTPQLS